MISHAALWLLAACSVTDPQGISSPTVTALTPAGEATIPPTPVSTEAPEEEILTIPDLLACDPPYQPDSIWNVPIDWSKAKIHPQSVAMVGALMAGRGFIGSNANSYAPTIHYVTDETPLVPVILRENRFRDAKDDRQIIYGEPGGTVMMPIPFGAAPSPGSDGQMAIINVSTGEEWGLREAAISTSGQWYASGAYRYHIANSGVPPSGFAQRGAGIGQLAGIIRPCEVLRGHIGHAVTLGYDYPCSAKTCAAQGWPEVIPPFKRTDGTGTHLYDIPMGARLVIRPEITQEQITSVCQGVLGCLVWVTNMQQYGGFIVDRSGGAKTYGEGNLTANWSSLIWHRRMLRDIPHAWFAVLDWSAPQTSGPINP